MTEFPATGVACLCRNVLFLIGLSLSLSLSLSLWSQAFCDQENEGGSCLKVFQPLFVSNVGLIHSVNANVLMTGLVITSKLRMWGDETALGELEMVGCF